MLYDHADETVLALLRAVHAALPEGGRLIVSEPMSGGARPDPITDTYFAFYTLAMGTGRTRSAARIAELMDEAGFAGNPQPSRHAPLHHERRDRAAALSKLSSLIDSVCVN